VEVTKAVADAGGGHEGEEVTVAAAVEAVMDEEIGETEGAVDSTVATEDGMAAGAETVVTGAVGPEPTTGITGATMAGVAVGAAAGVAGAVDGAGTTPSTTPQVLDLSI
jgi:hypothetical protein